MLGAEPEKNWPSSHAVAITGINKRKRKTMQNSKLFCKTNIAAAAMMTAMLVAAQPAAASPSYEHMVIVVEENHGYE